MKKTLLVLAAGIALSSTTVWAAGPGSRMGGGLPTGAADRMVSAAAAHPKAVQSVASAIAARPAAQAKMDAAMVANPAANDLMLRIQKAGGYTAPTK